MYSFARRRAPSRPRTSADPSPDPPPGSARVTPGNSILPPSFSTRFPDPQAYLDELLRLDFENTKKWCYTGVGVLEWDAKMRDYLKNNDWTFPIVSRVGESAADMAMHVHECVTLRDMILSFEDPAATVALLASDDVKIVSFTITEFGYRVPLSEGDHALVRHALAGGFDDLRSDAESERLPADARNGLTVFGLCLAALAARHRAGKRPFTIMSCDNLPHNGEVAKKRVLSAARDLDLDEALIRWLELEARYPSTMVDRITPATAPADLDEFEEKIGRRDEWPVMCEPYKHWVIEDNFVDGQRPAWEKVGALLVPDVRPHELMKVRLLNVTHSAMSYVGLLAGCEHVHEAVTHRMISQFLKRLMRDEIASTLRADPGMAQLAEGLDEYAELVLSRFKNVAVKDCLDRVAMDGSEKFRVQGRAVITEGLAADRTVRGFALYVAAWAHFLRRSVERGEKVRDASAGAVSAPWASPEGGGLEAFLDIEEVFGVLAHHEGWRTAVGREYEDIEETGLEASLLGCIFGIGHNSNGDLAAVGAAAERVSGTFILDETCVAPEQRADNDEAVTFVSLEA